MKKNISKALAIVLVVAIISVSLNFLVDMSARAAITIGGEKMLGTPIHMGGLSIGLIRPSIAIKDMVVYNPKDFPKGILLDIEKAGVSIDAGALLRGKLKFSEIYVDLKEVGVVKNADGKLNVDSLKVVQDKEGASKKDETKPAEKFPLRISKFTLSMDRVVYKDYSAGEIPDIKVYKVGIKEKTYWDVDSAEQLVFLLLLEGMKPTMIRGAAVYGAAAVLGVAFLPAGVAVMMVGNDSAEEVFNASVDRAFQASRELLEKLGVIKEIYEESGSIIAEVKGAKVTVDVTKVSFRKVKVVVTARQFFLPKPEVSGGILYHIAEALGQEQ